MDDVFSYSFTMQRSDFLALSRVLARRSFWSPLLLLLFYFAVIAACVLAGVNGDTDAFAAVVKQIGTGRAPVWIYPLLLLGRSLAMGYVGHVWSHGYDYAGPEAAVTSILIGQPGWRERAHQIGCRYLFWGDQEEEAYGGKSSKPWEREAAVVFRIPQGALFDLEAAPPLRPSNHSTSTPPER